MQKEVSPRNWMFYICIALILLFGIYWSISQQHIQGIKQKKDAETVAVKEKLLDKERANVEEALILKWHINMEEQADLLSGMQREHFLSEEVQNRLEDQSLIWTSACLKDVVSPTKEGGLYTFQIEDCHALWGNHFHFDLLGREELAIQAEKGNHLRLRNPCIAIFTVEHVKGSLQVPDRSWKTYEAEGKLLDLKMLPQGE